MALSPSVYAELAGLVRAGFETLYADIHHLRRELRIMSQSLSEQLDAALAGIKDDIAEIAADVSAVAQQISTLQSELSPGSTITQAQVDAINAQKAALDAVKASLDSLATPPAPAPTP
jgi:archaellum component FlaC